MTRRMIFLVMMAMGIMLLFLGAACTKKVHMVGPEQTGSTTIKAGDKGERVKGETGIDGKGSYRISDLAADDRARDLTRSEKIKTEIKEFESRPIYFDYDQADLTLAARENLAGKAAWLKANPDYTIIIEGHCDERGTSEYNLVLGDRRAEAARKYLISLGISEQRIETISYGEERPVDRRQNEEAWARNRRGEFRIIR